MERIYDPILFSFLIIGIALFGKDEKCKFVRCIVSVNFHVTTLIALITGSYLLGFFFWDFMYEICTPLLLICSCNTIRFVLYRKRKDILRLLKLLSNCRIKQKNETVLKNVKTILYLLCTGVICITISVFYVLVTSSLPENFKFFHAENSRWYLVIKTIHPNVDEIYGIAFVYTFLFSSFLPLCISNICYGLISWHLKTVLCSTKEIMLASPHMFKSKISYTMKPDV